MKLYFVRHGESEANLLREFSNSGTKHPLTAQGLAQAHHLAQSLAGLKVAQVYSSPVLRAVQTAQAIAERLDVPIEVTEALREWNVGIYEGTQDARGWVLHRQVQEDWFLYGRLESKMPGGESFLEIKARFTPFIESLVSRGEPDGSDRVLVGHGGLYIAMLPVVLKNIDHDFVLQRGFTYTGCVIAESGPEGLYCLEWCGEPCQMGC